MVITPTTIPNTAIFSLHLNPKTAKRNGVTNTGLLMSTARNSRQNRASLYLLVDNARDIEHIPMIKQAVLAKWSCCLSVSLRLRSGLTIS